MTTPEITAADREAAANWLWDLDYLPLAEAFARHRTEARNAALSEAAEVAEGNRTDDDSMWDRAAETITDLIRSLITNSTTEKAG